MGHKVEVIKWLNDNSGAIVAMATVALAVITLVYVLLTRKMVKGGDNTNKQLEKLANALKEGQILQDEVNLMRYYEILGNTKIVSKKGFDKAFPHHEEKRKKYSES